MKTLYQIVEQFPEIYQREAQELITNFQQSSPLKLCLVGGFSAGKSSLINMLLGDNYLPVSLEETTALPTFVEYGDEATEILGNDQTVLPVSLEKFQQATTNAPAGAAATIFRTPQEWLKELVLMDLPGLGSNTPSRRDYTLNQMRLADIVLYVFLPRGPSVEDMAILSMIKGHGKTVFGIVSQWDTIEEAIEKGERAPDLQQWQQQIKQQSGFDLSLTASSRQGHGKEKIIQYIEQSRHNIQQIRDQQLCAELHHLAQQFETQLNEQLIILEAQSKDDIQSRHNELIIQRHKMLKIKESLYQQKQHDLAHLREQSDQQISLVQKKLSTALNELPELSSDAQWLKLEQQGTIQLEQSLTQLTESIKNLSADYGQLDVPQSELSQLKIQLPEAPKLSLDEFMDAAKLLELQHQLENKQQVIKDHTQKLAQQNQGDKLESASVKNELDECKKQRQEIINLPLPVIIKQSEGSGKIYGRIAGEALDLALMFVNPELIAAKMTSILGKGAKAVKAAKVVSKGVKVAQGIKKGLPSITDKAEILEKISLGYWGERLFDNTTYQEIIDPQAEAEKNAQLADVQKKIATLQREQQQMQRIEQERDLTGWALEQNQQELQQLQSRQQQLEEESEQRYQSALNEAQRHYLSQLTGKRKQAVNQWLNRYDSYARSLANILDMLANRFWEQQLTDTLTDRLDAIEQLQKALQQAPEEKQQQHEQISQQITQIQSVLIKLDESS